MNQTLWLRFPYKPTGDPVVDSLPEPIQSGFQYSLVIQLRDVGTPQQRCELGGAMLEELTALLKRSGIEAAFLVAYYDDGAPTDLDGFLCQNCSRALVERQGDICVACRELLVKGPR